MKTHLLKILVVSVAIVGGAGALGTAALAQQSSAPQAADAASADLAHLKGVWVVTAAEQGGKPFNDIVGGHLTLDGTRFGLVTASGNKLDGAISIDPSRSPKQLDFRLSGGAVWLAIYSVSDKTLRLNYVEAADGDKRPNGFVTSSELRGTVIALRKEK